MALIVWKDEFSVGVLAIDHDHWEMIEKINRLHKAVIQGDSNFSVGDFLDEIYAHISTHFALEEQIMLEKKYDQYEDHKKEHERLLNEIRDIIDEHENNPKFSEHELAERLGKWFMVHFSTMDARLHKHLG